ncbi:MAG: HAMP domain-containing sensor histidine kinase, partial [Oscillospiraceae bacterium]
MEVKSKKAISIFRMFLQHIIGLAFAIVFLIFATIIIVSVSIQMGVVLPANYAEQKLNQSEEALKENFDAKLLPINCKYVLVDSSGSVKATNMSDKDMANIRETAANKKRPYYEFYKEIVQQNGNILFLEYDMRAHFSSPQLHKLIKNPELLLLIIILSMIILFVVTTALRFSKKLKENLIPINIATEKIKAQNLDFEIKPTKILEFNASLSAIESLKSALTISLNKQWDNEQQKKSQLSSLAHDIKTPLSVIKGNTELLLEDECTSETKEMLLYIQTSSNTIEKYLDLLMGVVNDGIPTFNKKSIPLKEFFYNVVEDVSPLCKTQGITLNIIDNAQNDCLEIDTLLLKRALINIVDNAIRFSPSNGHIDFMICDNETEVIFEIVDYGKGFSSVGLNNATQEYYTEDTARTGSHYGLGLSFVKKAVEMHNGVLKLENNAPAKGARVSIALKNKNSKL